MEEAEGVEGAATAEQDEILFHVWGIDKYKWNIK